MIIAIMGESFTKVREVATFVAMYERAKVILLWEQHRLQAQLGLAGRLRRSVHQLLPRCLKHKSSPFPSWLHVLVPAEHASTKGKDTSATPVSEGALIRRLEELEAALRKQMESSAAASTSQNSRAISELAATLKDGGGGSTRARRDSKEGSGADGGVSEKRRLSREKKRRISRDHKGGSAEQQKPTLASTAGLGVLLKKAPPSGGDKGGSPGASIQALRPSTARVRPVLTMPSPPPMVQPTPGGAPDKLITALLAGRAFDKAKAEEMARRIREPGYTLRMFYEACIDAFPELTLYLADNRGEMLEPDRKRYGAKATSSGRSHLAEFNRTIGALFAICIPATGTRLLQLVHSLSHATTTPQSPVPQHCLSLLSPQTLSSADRAAFEPPLWGDRLVYADRHRW